MKPTLDHQLQILTFAKAEWEIERRHVTIINWTVCPKDTSFDFAAYDYRVALPPLPEGYEVVPIDTKIKAGTPIAWIESVRTDWVRGSVSYDFVHKTHDTIYAVKKQPSYPELHKASGLKVGDRVRVTRSAENHEDGWENSWYLMDSFVGGVFTIAKDRGQKGFELSGTEKDFPCFVLQKVTTMGVPLTMAELPKGAGLWYTEGVTQKMVVTIEEEGVRLADGGYVSFRLMVTRKGRLSTDRQNWIPGWKEVEV